MAASRSAEENRPVVAVLIPPEMRKQILSPEAERRLGEFALVNESSEPAITTETLPELLDGAVACITGWGTPPLDEHVLSEVPGLRLVAHTAGSIRHLVPEAAMERGLRVSHAAAIIADAVAELVVRAALLGVRRLHEIDRLMKDGKDWSEVRAHHPGRLLGTQTIGVVGAGYVGRTVIRFLAAFGCRVLVCDPSLDEERAAALGSEVRGLDELFAAADLVTIHAPVLPETRGMVGATQLGRLRDGGIFINTARAVLVDDAALLREVRSGRIFAVLDVFDQEPLPVDAPIRALPNVVLSPHIAGRTADTYLRQGDAMVEEVRRFLSGDPLRYEVTPAMLPTMA
jgi:phosphoglycerate dehydrogenase-like enzyme